MSRKFNYDPVELEVDGKFYLFINEDVAEDYVTDLEDVLNAGKKDKDCIYMIKGVDYDIKPLKIYLSSAELITEKYGI